MLYLLTVQMSLIALAEGCFSSNSTTDTKPNHQTAEVYVNCEEMMGSVIHRVMGLESVFGRMSYR